MSTARALAIIAAILAAPSAGAADGLSPDRLLLPLASVHTGITTYVEAGRARPFNETNPGVGLVWQDRGPWPLDVSIGAFRNSFGGQSSFVHLSRTWPIGEDRWGLRAGPFLGVAHYGADARHIGTRLGQTGVVAIGGLVVQAGPVFATVSPNRADGRWGAIVGLGLSAPLPQ